MTERQQRFCDEYLIDANATQAAIRVGYSRKTAYSQGQRLLKNVEIQKYIDQQLEQIHNEKIADVSEVMRYLTSVMRGESESEIVVVEGDGDGFFSARNVTKKPDEKDKLKAAELIGKRYGMFKDGVNINGVVPVVLDGGDQLED